MRGAGALRTTFAAGKNALASSQTAAAIAPHMRQMLGKLKDFKPSDLSAMMSRASRFVEGLKGPVPGPGPSPSVAGHTILRRPLSANRLQSQFRAYQATHDQSRPVAQASMSDANATTNATGDTNPATNTGDGQYADGAPRGGGKSPGPAGASANPHINATTNATGETNTDANTGERQYADGAPHEGSKTPWPAGIGEHPTPADFIPHIFQQAGEIFKGAVSSGEHSGMFSPSFARNIRQHVMPGLTQLSNIVAPALEKFAPFWKDAYEGEASGDPGKAQASRAALDAFRKHAATGVNNALGLLDAAATPGVATSEQQRISRQQARARQSE